MAGDRNQGIMLSCSDSSGVGLHALIVEDEPLIGLSLKDCVERAGIEAVWSSRIALLILRSMAEAGRSTS